MIAAAPTSAITFEIVETITPLIAPCAPTTSLFRRDISSPVFVSVKKRSDIRCRWS